MSDIYLALAAPARRHLLDEIKQSEGLTLFDLCTRLSMKHGMSLTRQAVSQRLAMLEEVGLVRTRKEGRYKYHYFNPEPLREILGRWLDEA